MKELLRKYEETDPEIIFEWNDRETEARGWVVINSLRGGAAGGGTRMRKGLDKNEVVSLAKTMEIKFTVSGPAIGGAKSGIDFDPSDPRKKGVLERWYKAVSPILKNYYGTGGDMNVDEIHEVIPITESFGIWHPQEGIVNGHFNPTEAEKIRKIGQLRNGVSKVLEDPNYCPDGPTKYRVADMITGFGVSESVKHFYSIFRNESLEGKRVIVQGWGNVASAAAMELAHAGARIVGVIDKDGGLISESGFGLEEVKNLFINHKKGNKLEVDSMLSFDEVNSRIWDVNADVFIPAAASRLVTADQLNRLVKAGLKTISSGANVPFADKEIFYGPIMSQADDQLSLIPDFIANCGMARAFAFLMTYEDKDLTDDAIFSDTSKTIYKALKKVHEKNSSLLNVSNTAFQLALEELLEHHPQQEIH
ncbi:MAG: amino acid dehydrogenase [Flavobacteriales bacterium]|nr:amino acid dehydrogenase [Flavobacteriales bacterium]